MNYVLAIAYAAYCNHFAIRRKPGEKLLTFHSWKRQYNPKTMRCE